MSETILTIEVDHSAHHPISRIQNHLNRIHLLFAEYPFDTRKIQFDYGFLTEESCRLGRLRGLSIPGQDGLATYQYAGLDRTVKLTYLIPEIELSYISHDGAPGDDAGDPYSLRQGLGGEDIGWESPDLSTTLNEDESLH